MIPCRVCRYCAFPGGELYCTRIESWCTRAEIGCEFGKLPDGRTPTRVLVVGPRNWYRRDLVDQALDFLLRRKDIQAVIHSETGGLDAMVEDWGVRRHVPRERIKPHQPVADCVEHYLRLLEEGQPNGIIAFPGSRAAGELEQRAAKKQVKTWYPLGR